MNGNGERLKRSLGLKDLVILSFGSMIGWSWIMLAGKWIELAGIVGALLAFVLGAILSVFIGLAYAELTPMLPRAGGILVFAYRGLGYRAAWLTGWMISFAYIGVAALEGPAMLTALDYLVPLPRMGYLWSVAGFDVYLSWVLIGSVGGAILTYINYRGVRASAVFQTVATLVMAFGGVCFLVGGAAYGQLENMFPVMTSTKGLVAVILMVPTMFVGFDVIPQAAEEMNIPLKKIPVALIGSICLAAAWYMLMILGIALAAPPEVRDAASVPLADAFAFCMGHSFFGKFMILAALCGILTSWNGFLIGASRVLFSMGRAKMLPEIFSKMHHEYRTPVAALGLVGLISCLSPLLGKTSLIWFVDASAFGTVVAYFMVSLSFLALRKKEPQLARPYKVKSAPLVGGLGLAVAGFFLYLYLPFGPGALLPVEWAMVLAWAALGVVLYALTHLQYSKVEDHEREILIFGADYSRPQKERPTKIAPVPLTTPPLP